MFSIVIAIAFTLYTSLAMIYITYIVFVGTWGSK